MCVWGGFIYIDTGWACGLYHIIYLHTHTNTHSLSLLPNASGRRQQGQGRDRPSRRSLSCQLSCSLAACSSRLACVLGFDFVAFWGWGCGGLVRFGVLFFWGVIIPTNPPATPAARTTAKRSVGPSVVHRTPPALSAIRTPARGGRQRRRWCCYWWWLRRCVCWGVFNGVWTYCVVFGLGLGWSHLSSSPLNSSPLATVAASSLSAASFSRNRASSTRYKWLCRVCERSRWHDTHIYTFTYVHI